MESDMATVSTNKSTAIHELMIHKSPNLVSAGHEKNQTRKCCKINDQCCFAWLSVVSMFLIYMINGGIQYSIGIMFVVVLDVFEATRSSTVVISSLWLFVAFAMCYPSGLLVERTSTRCAGVIGAIIGFASFMASAFASNVYILYFTYSILGGTAYSLLIMASSTCVATQHSKHRSLAMGLGTSGGGIGTMLFSPLVTMLYNEYVWKDACLLLAGIFLHTLVLSLLLRPPDRLRLRRISGQEKEQSSFVNHKEKLTDNNENQYDKAVIDPESQWLTNSVTDVSKPSSLHLLSSMNSHLAMYQSAVSLKNAMQDNSVEDKTSRSGRFCTRFFKDERLSTTVVLSTIFPQTGLSVFVLFLPDFVLSRGYSQPEAALLVSAYGISNLAGLLGGGFIGQCMKRGRYYLYTSVVLCTGVVLIATPWFVSYVGFLACSIVFGFCDGVRICQLPVLIAEYVGPERFGSYVGFSYALAGIVISILLPILGYASETLQSYKEIFRGVGSVVAVAAIALYCIRGFCPAKQKS